MNAREIMTNDPACVTAETPLRRVAALMAETDCGCIPVVDDLETRRPIGVVTDRDIVCRAVARGSNPLELAAKDCMTVPCVTVQDDATLGQIIALLEEKMIRRVTVVDAQGRVCGIVAQADLARHASERQTGEVVRKVSEHTIAPSNV